MLADNRYRPERTPRIRRLSTGIPPLFHRAGALIAKDLALFTLVDISAGSDCNYRVLDGVNIIPAIVPFPQHLLLLLELDILYIDFRNCNRLACSLHFTPVL